IRTKEELEKQNMMNRLLSKSEELIKAKEEIAKLKDELKSKSSAGWQASTSDLYDFRSPTKNHPINKQV
ncbi:hypothetical protein QUF72_18795, partial [Desulfobacterales bacterium HSG2]|nr:hypothetical protein [Desulfobacterales bacterium HSG2]